MAEFAEFALRRTYRNGARCAPLSIEEISAIQKPMPMKIDVGLMHGADQKSVICDSASTAGEVCSELTRQLNIKTKFGWALFIEIGREVGENVRQTSIVVCHGHDLEVKLTLVFCFLGLFVRLSK
jgi:hypothetical protein